MADFLYDKATELPPRGSPLDVLFQILHREKSEQRFLELMLMFAVLPSGSDTKEYQERLRDMLLPGLPGAKSTLEEQKKLLADLLGMGPLGVRKLDAQSQG